MYGRQPENIEVINQVFHNLLGKFQSGAVLKAFEIWMARNQEFPTPADIIGIIKRRGKPPLSKEMYISISRKDYEDRTWQEQNYMLDYEQEMQESEWGSELNDPEKETAMHDECVRLRKALREKCEQYDELAETLRKERIARGKEKPSKETLDKVTATVAYLRNTGASEEDILAFTHSQYAPEQSYQAGKA